MESSKKTLIFTGGGSGGHVMPALTIIKKINEGKAYDIHYVGGIESIERELVRDYELTYHPIHTGKLRRYLSLENLKDLGRILLGLIDSWRVLSRFNSKSSLIFSSGGFVSVPVVVAAALQGKKVFIHEQTSRVGLANKICSFFATKVFISFEDSFNYFNPNKTFYSGYPLREECFDAHINPVVINGRLINDSKKPILFITGGGNGAMLLNKLIEKNLDKISKQFLIIHQTGKLFIGEFEKYRSEDYIPLAFVGKEMIDLFKLASITLSRSGAGTVCELVAIGKKSIFIPLKIAQKNEQYYNALEAQRKLGSIVIEEKNLNDDTLMNALSSFGAQNPEQKSAGKNGLIYLINEINSSF